jgi:predicted Zn-dependent protease
MISALATALPSQDEALSAIAFAIQHSQADAITASIKATEAALTRFSENQATQNIGKNGVELQITSYFGKRRATATSSTLDRQEIGQTLRRCEDLARIAPEDPEWVPLLPPQSYDTRLPAFDAETASLPPQQRGELVRQTCSLCQKAGVEGSGTLSSRATVRAVGNSLGLQAFDRTTETDFSLTARVDSGSSWNRRTAWGIRQLPLEAITEQAIARAKLSRQPREVQPATYTVIFTAAAFADLLWWVVSNLEARAADEGRSFMAKTNPSGIPAGNRVGEPLFSPLVQVQRHPGHPLLQAGTFFPDGLPNSTLTIIQDGIPQTLAYSRYWAVKRGREATGNLFPIVMQGSDRSLSDLIAETERGILVSRAWYVRYTNPRTLEVTGMTRDGTFWLEGGKIAHPIKNLRFNQCLPEMLRQIDAISRVERVGSLAVPGVRVKAFNFSSVTDSI